MRKSGLIGHFPWFARILLMMLVCTFLSTAIHEVSAQDVWPMYQQNASHTGYLPISVNPSKFCLRWQKTIGALDLNPVTAADGMVFVSEVGYFNNPGLYALDAATGTTIWSKNYGDVFSVNPPSYSYGNVYIQTGNHSDDTYLRAYKADTGDFVFRAAHFAQWERYYAPTIYDGSVYVNGGYYGGMYAFDAFTGEQQWFQSLPQYDQWTPAVDENVAYAYVGEYSPGLYAFNRFTGDPVLMIPDPNFDWDGWSMKLAPVLGSMGDVIAIHDGRLISFDLVNENIRWELDGNFSGQPSVVNGVIYSIASGALNARDQMTGALLWGWEVPTGNLEGTIIVTDSHLLVHTSSDVYAVDLVTHDQAWSYPAAGHLSISEGTLYIAGADGLLVAINIDPPDPVPDIKANGQDGPLFISKDDPTRELINITVALVPGYMEGRSCDWWVGALTPFGTYWLNPQRNWVKSESPIYVGQYPLFRFSSFSIFNDTLPTGIYTFFFILDKSVDGIFDMTWFDYVVVVVASGDSEQQMDEPADFEDLFRERIQRFMKQ